MFEGRDLTCVRGERVLFAGLDFRLDAGDACLVTGRNGSGKSSLLRLMAGLLTPFEGEILWHGVPVAEDREDFSAAMHYVGHLDAVKPVLTVAENLTFWAKLRGGSGIGAGLDAFDLEDLRDLPGRMLSAGQKRRVALARLLVAPAPLWLLDEPTVALDTESVRAVERAVAIHRAAGGLAVISSNVPIDLPGAIELPVAHPDVAPA